LGDQFLGDAKKYHDCYAFYQRSYEKSYVFYGFINGIHKKIQDTSWRNEEKVVEAGPMEVAAEGDVAARNYCITPISMIEKIPNAHQSHVVVGIEEGYVEAVYLQVADGIYCHSQH
jgi:hypothetical protein